MNNNEQIIADFYKAFQQLNADEMNKCYSHDVVFFDPVFELLRGDEVRAMWEMLCKRAKDFSLSFGDILNLGDDYYTCDILVSYEFTKTGRKVVNKIKAHMKIENGLIVEHSDAFSIHKWSSQALGFSGWLLGWNSFFQRRIKNNAKRGLMEFMTEKNNP